MLNSICAATLGNQVYLGSWLNKQVIQYRLLSPQQKRKYKVRGAQLAILITVTIVAFVDVMQSAAIAQFLTQGEDYARTIDPTGTGEFADIVALVFGIIRLAVIAGIAMNAVAFVSGYRQGEILLDAVIKIISIIAGLLLIDLALAYIVP